MPYVYLLRCADDTFYTGWTMDLDRRLEAHNRGTGSRYTRARLPVQLVYAEQTPDKSCSLKREHQVRRLSRKDKEQLVALYTHRTMEPHKPTDP